MKRRKFVITSTVLVAVIAVTVAGLAIWSNFSAKAAIGDLPRAVLYMPADSQAVFGMNVREFVLSPLYARIEEKHGREIGRDLDELIEKTGVDPRRDVDYIVAAGRSLGEKSGSGVVIATGRFDPSAITQFIYSQKTPIRVDYKGSVVLMIPEEKSGSVDKGIAMISPSEIGLGDLDSLKAVLDARENRQLGIQSNEVLMPLLSELDPRQMFWFAGNAANVIEKAPANTPLGGNLGAIQTVLGTLNLNEYVSGKITATARDVESAGKLADVAKGLVALGQLAANKSTELTELMRGISVAQDGNRIHLLVNFPIEVLDQLENLKHQPRKVI